MAEKAKLRAAERILELEKQFIQKKLDYELAIIDEEESDDSQQLGSSDEELIAQKELENQENEEFETPTMPVLRKEKFPSGLGHELANMANQEKPEVVPDTLLGPKKGVNMPFNHIRGAFGSATTTPLYLNGSSQEQGNPIQGAANAGASVTDLATTMTLAFQNLATSHSAQQSPQHVNRYITRQNIKELPEFDGNPEKWLLFIDQVNRSTIVGEFGNADNLTRIQKALKGPALAAVESMLLSPENVPEILRILERQFGRPELIMQTLTKKVQKLNRVSEENLGRVYELNNCVQSLVTAIRALGVPAYMINPQMMADICDKMSPQMQIDWGRYVSKNRTIPSVSSVADWLSDYADAIGAIPGVSAYKTSGSGEKKPKKETKNYRVTSLTTVASSDESQSSSTVWCVECRRRGHGLAECNKFAKKKISERWNVVRKHKICRSCLGKFHRIDTCKRKQICKISGCNDEHHALLHYDKVSTSTSESTGQSTTAIAQPTATATSETGETSGVTLASRFGSAQRKFGVLLKVLPVVVSNGPSKVTINAILDEASTTTMIDAETAKMLGVVGVKERLTLDWITQDSAKNMEVESASLNIGGVDTEETFAIHGVKIMSGLLLPAQYFQFKGNSCKHLKELPLNLELVNSFAPKMLIGQDNGHLIVSRKLKEGGPNEPLASETKLGWVVHGVHELGSDRNEEGAVLFIKTVSEDDELHMMVKDHFKVESMGIMPNLTPLENKNDERARLIFEKTTNRIDDRFETGLPWKSDDLQLVESRLNAEKRLAALEKKLDRDPELSREYCAKIEEYLQKGYTRKLTPREKINTAGPVWYLPHVPTYNKNKPEKKMRVIFDAAAKSHGYCLNDYLLQGPDLLRPLHQILFGFRQKDVGISADIKEMFPQVKIIEKDARAQRFLWRGTDRNKDPDVYEMTSMIFGATCSPYLAQRVKNLNAEEHKDQYPEAARAITERHYVDDYLDSVCTPEEAIKLVQDVTTVHKKGGLEIRGWITSSSQVDETIPEAERSDKQKNLGDKMSKTNSEKILGLSWNPKSDELTYKCSVERLQKITIKGDRPTKREVLTILMSMFDPLGVLSPYLVKGKILLQEIWRTKMGL